jgi:hypothetical protein
MYWSVSAVHFLHFYYKNLGLDHWIWISQSLDQDPESEKCLDPDLNSDSGESGSKALQNIQLQMKGWRECNINILFGIYK